MFASKNLFFCGSRLNVVVTISSSTLNYTANIAKISGYVVGQTDATFIINSGVVVGSTSTSTAGLTVSGWTAGDTVTIINNGYIVGAGGNGGTAAGSAGGNPGGNNGQPGGAGGPALTVSYAVSINNASGVIGGGGGGGGGGGANSVGVATGRSGAGGGGAGNIVGIGGFGAGSGNGSNGTLTTGGAGVGPQTDGGAGGAGGNLGTAGIGGSSGNAYSGSPGGAGGYCTSAGSNSYVTWISTGTRYGTLG